jgi:hypothetical protein
MDLNEAAARIVELYGEFRVPTLLGVREQIVESKR